MGEPPTGGRLCLSLGQPSPVSTPWLAHAAVELAPRADIPSSRQADGNSPATAVEAQLATPQGPVIAALNSNRLPAAPLHEAHKRSALRAKPDPSPQTVEAGHGDGTKEGMLPMTDNHGSREQRVTEAPNRQDAETPQEAAGENTLGQSTASSHTMALFPPLPLYGPPSPLRHAQCLLFRASSFFLSLAFLGTIVCAALVTSIPALANSVFHMLTLRNVDTRRPFYQEEVRRADVRKKKQEAWARKASTPGLEADQEGTADEFPPSEGGKDPIICDVGYYARRVGLGVEDFEVQTEDGFIIDLWHVFDPRECGHARLDGQGGGHERPFVQGARKTSVGPETKHKFPVLLMHGLLQSSGAYCCNDDESLAFWLCKSGFDVWLGNNRCGFTPRHAVLSYGDPRMWCWDIRQMAVFDLPALTSRVLRETGFEKLGLICHSQGTAEALVALSKEHRPDLGQKLTVFCALAPAAYAGPLLDKACFKFMRVMAPGMFSTVFGIHAFIPLMMQMHRLLHPRLYGWMGYTVFSYLFNWSDARWDRGLRNRMFQFAPVYVSAESMRWWLGRECFAKHRCILATEETTRAKDEAGEAAGGSPGGQADSPAAAGSQPPDAPRGGSAWYNEQAPPFALWVCGNDDLVDGRRLLSRFQDGREPHVTLVHGRVVDGYEHLDVLWAMDAPERVFAEIRDVLWKTCNARDVCRVPVGCEDVEPRDSEREALEAGKAEKQSAGR